MVFLVHTRGLIGGGGYPKCGTNSIDFVTIATTGNAQDFGDLTLARTHYLSAALLIKLVVFLWVDQQTLQGKHY